jgi:tape measure domain-containing protein
MATAVLRTLAVRLRMNSAAFRKDIDQVDRRFKKMANNMQRSAMQFQNQLGQLGVTIASGFGVAALTEAADEMVNLRNKMNATFDASEDVARGMLDIKRIARESRADISAVGTLYQRIAVSTEHLGTSQEDVAAVTQVVTNSFLMSGTTASEAANSARQFAQGLASGTLRGDEFRSVSENNVVLTNMLAEGLNMTVGELRLFSQEGGLTAERIMPLLIDRLEETNAAVGKMDVTLGQARVLFSNAFTEMVDRVNQTYGVTNRLASVMATLAENVHLVVLAAGSLATILLTQVVRGFLSWIAVSVAATVTTTVGLLKSVVGLASFLARGFIAAVAGATTAIIRLTVAMLANPIGLIITGVLALGAAFLYLQEKFKVIENGMKIWGHFKEVAVAAFDTLKAKFEEIIVKSKLFFARIRTDVADTLRSLGADSLADALMPSEGVTTLEGRLSTAEALVKSATDRMNAASMNALRFTWDSDQDGANPITAIKAKVAEMMSSLGIDPEGSMSGQLFEGLSAGFTSAVDGIIAKMSETFPQIAQFWKVVKGEIDPDAAAAGAGSPDEGSSDPLTWAERWKLALEKFGEAWQSLKTGAGATIDTLKEKYKTLDDVLAAGAQKSKKLAALRRALLLKEAIMNGKAAILKAWNSAPFPANLPGVLLTTAQTGLIVRDIMKGQAHDGMDSLPSTGTYMLEKGERVLSTRANRDLTQYLADRNNAGKMEGPQNVTLQVNGVSDPDLVVNALASRRGELEAMIRSISAENVRLAPF